MHKDISNWVKRIKASDERLAMPIMTYPGLELVGLQVADIIRDGRKQFECIKALGERFPLVAVVSLMDLSVEAEAFGCTLRFADDEVPCVIHPALTCAEGVKELEVPSVNSCRMPVYLQAASLAADHFSDRLGLGGMIGPFSLAGRVRDLTEMLMDTLIDPELLHELLEKCTQFLIAYAQAFKAAGADGLVIAEPAAGLIAPDQCDEFSSNYVRSIVDAVQDEHFAVIVHNCGATAAFVPSLLNTGALGLHFGNSVAMPEILSLVPETTLVFGNIDPAGVLRYGTYNEVRETTLELLDATSSFPHFILSSGCDIPPGTPMANLDALFSALRRFNALHHLV